MSRIKLTFLLSLSCMFSCFADATLTSLQHRAQVLDGVSYPRDYEYRFRGQESELFTLEDALKAFFGLEEAMVESAEFSAISLILQGKFWYQKDEDLKVKRLRTSFCRDWSRRDIRYNDRSKDCFQLDHKFVDNGKSLRDELDELLKTKRSYSQKESSKIAKRILDKQFSYEEKNHLKERLIDYSSGFYEDFPVDVIFSTVYPQNAAIYGDTVLVFTPKDGRSVDLSFFNGVSSNRWGFWGDAGEYITPGYIKSSELSGIHLRKRGEYPDKLRSSVSIESYASQKDYPIEVAFYKQVYNKKTYVLVFDGEVLGRKSKCLKPDSTGKVVHCRLASAGYLHNGSYVLYGNQKIPANTNYEGNLIGVLVLHKDQEKPEDVQFILDQFPYKSAKSLSLNLKNSNRVGEPSPLKTIKDFKTVIAGESYKLSFVRAQE